MATRHGPVDRDAASLQVEHHLDREALLVQIRALATCVARLVDAVEELAPERSPEVDRFLDDVRWELKEIW
jgi:hypothetical protein